jgi:hypothetical protein
MTSTVTAVSLDTVRTHTYATLSTTVGVIAILLLLVLLAHKELLRPLGRRGVTVRLRAFDVAIIPLLVSFLWIITVRFALFLH